MEFKEIAIEDYVKQKGQADLSRLLGVSQVAIHRALRAKRKIFIRQNGEEIEAFEIRPFPHSHSTKKVR